MNNLIKPWQGELVNLVLADDQAEQLKLESESFPAITLSQRQQCDLEMLLNGALSPLTGFMTEEIYNAVINNARLPNGVLWPMPYYLDVDEEFAGKIEVGSQIALRDVEGFMPAVLISRKYLATGQAKGSRAGIRHHGSKSSRGELSIQFSERRLCRRPVVGVQLPFHYDFETALLPRC